MDYNNHSKAHTNLLIASLIIPLAYFVSQLLYIWLADLRWGLTASMLLPAAILSVMPMIYALGEKLGFYDFTED